MQIHGDDEPRWSTNQVRNLTRGLARFYLGSAFLLVVFAFGLGLLAGKAWG